MALILVALVLVPLLVGAGLALGGRGLPSAVASTIAVVTAVLTLGAAVAVAVARPEIDHAWLPELGVRLHLAVDGISVPLILLTALVGVLVTVLNRAEVETQSSAAAPGSGAGSRAMLLGCLLLVEGGALATFMTRDALLFFIAFETVLVPMWVIITRFGDDHEPRARREAGLRFLLYTAVGSTLMLVGILLLVTSTGTSDLGELATVGAALPAGRQLTIALLLTVGLAVKVPVFPLHTWLPAAHTIAPTVGSVLLAAILLKLGTYGLVRLPLATVPDGFGVIAPWLGVAGVIGILWGGLVCLVERDLKRLIAYSSVAHMGFVVLGIASGSALGLQAALYANLAHGVISALLFVVVGGLKAQWGSVDLARRWPALRDIAPRRGFFLVLGLAASLGLPGLAGFWGEFLSIAAAWQPADPAHLPVLRTSAILAAVGGVLAAAYAVRVAKISWLGGGQTGSGATADNGHHEATGIATTGIETTGGERFVLVVLASLILALGLMPWWAMSVMAPAVELLTGGAAR